MRNTIIIFLFIFIPSTLVHAQNSTMPADNKSVDTTFYDNGGLKSISHSVDGVLSGQKTTYYKNGQKKFEMNFVKGKKHGLETMWSEAGVKSQEIPYENGERHGEGKSYWESGELKYNFTFVHGKLQGVSYAWYKSGKKAQDIPYQNDKKHGTEKWYYETGEVEKEIPYVNGVIHGTVVGWYKNGYPKERGYFDHGREKGVKRYNNPEPNTKSRSKQVTQIKTDLRYAMLSSESVTKWLERGKWVLVTDDRENSLSYKYQNGVLYKSGYEGSVKHEDRSLYRICKYNVNVARIALYETESSKANACNYHSGLRFIEKIGEDKMNMYVGTTSGPTAPAGTYVRK